MRTNIAGETMKGWGPAVHLFITVAVWSSAAVAGPLLPAPPADGDVATLEARIGQTATLPDLIALAQRSNPMIRAARAGRKCVVEKYRVDMAWPNPEGLHAALPRPVARRGEVRREAQNSRRARRGDPPRRGQARPPEDRRAGDRVRDARLPAIYKLWKQRELGNSPDPRTVPSAGAAGAAA